MAIIISIGSWGGIYIARNRICLGWIAVSCFAFDGDDLLKAAAFGVDMAEQKGAIKSVLRQAHGIIPGADNALALLEESESKY